MKLKVELDLFSYYDGYMYNVACPALNLEASGGNEDEARKSFDLSIKMFLEESMRVNTLTDFLLSLGWTLKGGADPLYQPPKINDKDMKKLNSSYKQTVNKFKESLYLPAGQWASKYK